MSKWWQWPEELKEEESRNKLARATEEYEKQLSILENFEKTDKWSGLGESMDVPFEKLRDELKAELKDGTELNSGKYGVVWKTSFRGVTLARKTIKLNKFTKDQVKMALNEGKIVRGLDRHRHIVKIVGTCLQDFDTARWDNGELHILMFPVAHCDLAKFLDDCEEVSAPCRSSLMDLPSHLERLVALGFHASKTAEELRRQIQSRFREMLGCLADAVYWMHQENIEHRDLKPANILVRPGQVLITDFGISRMQEGTARNTTDYHVGYTLGYAAPEILRGDYYNAKECDVYSLGCVFLHILTVIYGPNVKSAYLSATSQLSRDVFRERCFRTYLKKPADPRQPTQREGHQFLPPHLVALLAGILDENGKQRPKISNVKALLHSFVELGEQYYGPCCRSNDTPPLAHKDSITGWLGVSRMTAPLAKTNKPHVAPYIEEASNEATIRPANFGREAKFEGAEQTVIGTTTAKYERGKDAFKSAPEFHPFLSQLPEARVKNSNESASFTPEAVKNSAAVAEAETEAQRSRYQDEQARKDFEEAVAKAAYEKLIKEMVDAEIGAVKAKAEADVAEARAKAETEIAAIKAEAEATKATVLDNEKKPIKFKDAVGRTFNFPFSLCKTWKGMHDLICQAFEHNETLRPLVQDGFYDLVGPAGEFVLPQIWQTVVEPGWTVAMYLWPIEGAPEKEEARTRLDPRQPLYPGGVGRDRVQLPTATPVPEGQGRTEHRPAPVVEVAPDKPKKKQQQQRQPAGSSVMGWSGLNDTRSPRKAN